jgi:hypothetical protein
VTSPPAVDVDGFPLLPALPGGRPVPVAARSLARLVAGIRGTAVLTARTEGLVAMVVFLDREPIDGLVVSGDRRVTGPDVLDEIADVPVDAISVTEVSPELAVALGSYFLPTGVRQVPATVVLPEDFVRSLARPGQRGCVLVRAGDALGLVFVADGRVLLAYRADGEASGGLEQVAPLFERPGATLWARLGPDPGLARPDTAPRPQPARTAPAPPYPAAPPSASPPEPPAAPTWAEPGPYPGALPGAGPGLAPDQGAALVRAILEEVRQVLGPHTVRVEGVFLHAEPSAAGLRAAAESLRERRIRLVSRNTLDLVVDRALSVVERAGA